MFVKYLKYKWFCLLKKKINNKNLKEIFVGFY